MKEVSTTHRGNYWNESNLCIIKKYSSLCSQIIKCDALWFSESSVTVYVLEGYLATRLGPSFLWDLDRLCLSLGLLQSYALSPVGRQPAPGSPGACCWPSWTRHGIFQPASSLRPAQLLQTKSKGDKESSGVTLHAATLYDGPTEFKMWHQVKNVYMQPRLTVYKGETRKALRVSFSQPVP